MPSIDLTVLVGWFFFEWKGCLILPVANFFLAGCKFLFCMISITFWSCRGDVHGLQVPPHEGHQRLGHFSTPLSWACFDDQQDPWNSGFRRSASGIILFFINRKVARNGVVLEDAVFGSYFMLRYHITIKTTEPKVFQHVSSVIYFRHNFLHCTYTMFISICLNLFIWCVFFWINTYICFIIFIDSTFNITFQIFPIFVVTRLLNITSPSWISKDEAWA